MENIASDHDESDVEELPEVDISVLSVQPYMFEHIREFSDWLVDKVSLLPAISTEGLY